MKRNYLLLVAILSLAFASFACSVFGGDDADNGTEIESPQATQPNNDQPPQATQPGSDQPPEATEAPEFEEASIDASSLWAVDNVQSYRGDFTMIFDGTSDLSPVKGSIIMNIEATYDPPRQHTIMEMDGYELDLGWADFSSFEFYIIEDTIYLSYGNGGDWISLTSDLEDLFSEEFVSPENFVDFPDKAMRRGQPENVNGVKAWHYVLDEDDFSEKYNQYEDVTGDVWIAVDGGYVVKVDLSMTGTFSAYKFGDQPVDQGTIRYSYNLRDVNENFAIVLPGETASADETPLPEDTPSPGGTPPPDGQGGGVKWFREDVPLPEDAVIISASDGNVTAQTKLSYEETVVFFQTKLRGNGWVVDWENTGATKIFNGGFEKGGETLTLNLTTSFIGPKRVHITITVGH